jgi:hypothetical protein
VRQGGRFVLGSARGVVGGARRVLGITA